jgi:hypothetical protein
MRRTALVFVIAIAGLLLLVEKTRTSRAADVQPPAPTQTASP